MAPPDEVGRAPAPTMATLRGAKNGRRSGTSELQGGGHRHVIGGRLPAARGARDMVVAQPAGERRRDPDVIEPAAAVARRPVAVAIAPPAVELFGLRDEMPDRVDP